MSSNIKLHKLEFAEWVGDRLDWEVSGVLFQDLVLILGDNAQGKTRLFNILNFLHGIHLGTRNLQNPRYRGECRLTFGDEADTIFYKMELQGSTSGTAFNEVIERNEELVFERSKGLLVNEFKKENVSKFFLPNTSPVTTSVREDDYPTIRSIQSFFERMVFLQANRFAGDQIAIDPAAVTLNATASNIGSVLSNWEHKYPTAYGEVLESFKRSYPFIEEVSTKEVKLQNGLTATLLSLKEKGDPNHDIDQVNWSDGLLRSLSLFALPCTQFQVNGGDTVRPSMICIDEIENGLDFRTLAKVINHYDAYSNLVQIAMTTHSPLVCNLVDPSKWLIMKRSGPTVQAFVPSEVEDLDELRRQLKTDNWDFYRRHISQSDKYSLRDE